MIDQKHFNKLLSIHPKKSILQALMHGMIKDHYLFITDLNYTLILGDMDIKSGFLSIPEYRRTKNLEASLVDYLTEADFPSSPMINTGIKIPSEIFYNIRKFVEYCSSVDYTTRISLTGIHYDFESFEVCATNGHILHKSFLDKNSISDKLKNRKFIVPLVYGAVIQYITDNFTVDSVRLHYGKLDTGKSDMDTQYVSIEFGGSNTLCIKCIEGPYPQYNRIIPDVVVEETYTLNKIEKCCLLGAVKSMLPYTNQDTSAMYFIDEYIIVNNTESGKWFYTKIGKNPFRFTPTMLNGQYLQQILSDLPDGDISVFSEGAISANIFDCSTDVYILMSMRSSDDFNFMPAITTGKFIVPIADKAKSSRLTATSLLDIIRQNQNKTGKQILEIINN